MAYHQFVTLSEENDQLAPMHSAIRNSITIEIAAIVGGTACYVDHFAGSLLVCISIDNPLTLHCDHIDHGS